MPFHHYSIHALLLSLLLLPACGTVAAQQPGKQGRAPQQFSYRLLHSSKAGWGYDIYSGNKQLIHQTAVPAVPGNEGFSNKAAARKVARLVISKLQQGAMPPSVTTSELRSLKIIP